LFLWNSRPDAHRDDDQRVILWFQSLFLWNSRPDCTPTKGCEPALRVSILVFVELAPGRLYRALGRGHRRVSILVFVELAPGLGSGSSRAGFDLVSILVFVELAPGQAVQAESQEYLATFQSLFLWNSRPDSDGSHRNPLRSVVSILVFVELAPGRSKSRRCTLTKGVSILVFVELAPGL